MKFSKARIYKVHSGETKKDNNVQFGQFSHAKPKGKVKDKRGFNRYATPLRLKPMNVGGN